MSLVFSICKKILKNSFQKVSCYFLVSLCLISPICAQEILRLNIDGSLSGSIDIFLNDEIAPKHVERIRRLTNDRKYDGIVFHRVIPGFMAQTGDVKFGNISNLDYNLVGMGGSDYPMLEQEFSDGSFEKGTVGMARASDPNSANSQFFIMFEPAPHLNGKYTIIGEVVDGMDTVLGIKKGTAANNGAVESPDYIVKAELVKIEKK